MMELFVHSLERMGLAEHQDYLRIREKNGTSYRDAWAAASWKFKFSGDKK
jgi:hypothetical protein